MVCRRIGRLLLSGAADRGERGEAAGGFAQDLPLSDSGAWLTDVACHPWAYNEAYPRHRFTVPPTDNGAAASALERVRLETKHGHRHVKRGANRRWLSIVEMLQTRNWLM